MCDEIDSPENNQDLFEYIFPLGLLEEILEQNGYDQVRVTPSGDRVYCYDITMDSSNPVDRQAVRQHIENSVAQIPASATAHVRWRVELSAVAVTGQQVVAQIRVAYLQNAR